MAGGHYCDGRDEDIDMEKEGGGANHNHKIYNFSLPYTNINITYHSIFPI